MEIDPPPRFFAVHDALGRPVPSGPLSGAVIAMGNFEGCIAATGP